MRNGSWCRVPRGIIHVSSLLVCCSLLGLVLSFVCDVVVFVCLFCFILYCLFEACVRCVLCCLLLCLCLCLFVCVCQNQLLCCTSFYLTLVGGLTVVCTISSVFKLIK